jgi:hypothetical protein
LPILSLNPAPYSPLVRGICRFGLLDRCFHAPLYALKRVQGCRCSRGSAVDSCVERDTSRVSGRTSRDSRVNSEITCNLLKIPSGALHCARSRSKIIATESSRSCDDRVASLGFPTDQQGQIPKGGRCVVIAQGYRWSQTVGTGVFTLLELSSQDTPRPLGSLGKRRTDIL